MFAKSRQNRNCEVVMKVSANVMAVAVIFVILAAISLSAEQKNELPGKIKSVGVVYLSHNSKVPAVSISSKATKGWGKIETCFALEEKFTQEVKVEYLALMRNMRTVLTGSQTCLYVKGGGWRYTCMFVHPNAVQRYGGGIAGVYVKISIEDTVVV